MKVLSKFGQSNNVFTKLTTSKNPYEIEDYYEKDDEEFEEKLLESKK
jgi:hypothetical protein